MDFVEDIRVGQERAETGLRAEVDGAAAILSTREISRICIAKDPSAQDDKL